MHFQGRHWIGPPLSNLNVLFPSIRVQRENLLVALFRRVRIQIYFKGSPVLFFRVNCLKTLLVGLVLEEVEIVILFLFYFKKKKNKKQKIKKKVFFFSFKLLKTLFRGDKRGGGGGFEKLLSCLIFVLCCPRNNNKKNIYIL